MFPAQIEGGAAADQDLRLVGPDRPRAIDVATLPYPGFPTDLQPFVVDRQRHQSGFQAPGADGVRAAGDELRALLNEHSNVLAYVAGHTHENKVLACGSEDGCPDRDTLPGRAPQCHGEPVVLWPPVRGDGPTAG